MKRLIWAGMLLLFAFSAYAVGFFYTTETTSQAKKALSACETAYELSGDGFDEAYTLKELWCSKEGMLSLFVSHDSIDEIELMLSELCVYSNADEKNDFFERTECLKTLFHQIDEDTKLSFHSVF